MLCITQNDKDFTALGHRKSDATQAFDGTTTKNTLPFNYNFKSTQETPNVTDQLHFMSPNDKETDKSSILKPKGGGIGKNSIVIKSLMLQQESSASLKMPDSPKAVYVDATIMSGGDFSNKSRQQMHYRSTVSPPSVREKNLLH